jgi:hypothetical protein
MINRTIGRLRLELYSSIDELPSNRYHKFNVFCLISAGIGGDIESIQGHISKMYESLGHKDYEKLSNQLQNYYHALHLAVEGIDAKSVALSCLIHKINNEVITDISDDNLEAISKRISKEQNREHLIKLLNELKKKLKMKYLFISLKSRLAQSKLNITQ